MYRLSTPQSALQPFIEHYWHVYATPDRPFDLTVDVFVDLRPDLIINCGVPYHRTAHGGPRVDIARSNLDAQRLHPIRIEQRGALIVAGVRFRTGGLAPFVRQSVSAWTNGVVPIEDAFGADAIVLEAAVRDAGADVEPQTQAMDAFFSSRLTLTESIALTLRLKAVQEAHGGSVRIDTLAELGATTPRTVDRLFRRYIGVGPKTFSQVARFQRGLERLKTDPGVSLGTVAAECGYADHSHFVRAFRRFAGVAPSHRRGYFPVDAPTDFSPNVVRFVQDDDMRLRLRSLK